MLGPGRLTRAHLDYDACALVFRTAFSEADEILEHALAEAFAGAELRRIDPRSITDSVSYQVRFPLPTSLLEGREQLGRMRRGLSSMMARFEPDRFAALEGMIDTFGVRETLAGMHIHEAHTPFVAVPAPGAGSLSVH